VLKPDAHACKNAVVKSSKNHASPWQTALPTSSIRSEMKHTTQLTKDYFGLAAVPMRFLGLLGVPVKKI
jgi:hypothetical protein